jgi:hypothetical protein
MDEIVSYLNNYKLKKEIKLLLNNLNPYFSQKQNLSEVFLELYRSDLLSAEHYLYMQTKLLLKRFCIWGEKSIEKHNISIAVYFYDQQQQTIWIGGAPSVPEAFVEYSNGLHVGSDIAPGEESPLYTNTLFKISNVATSTNMIVLNHQQELLISGIMSFCCLPIIHNLCQIGHVTLYSPEPMDWNELDLLSISNSIQHLQASLFDAKEHFIQIANDQ